MITFTIPGKPFGKQRPRATGRGGFARMYTPKETVSFERVVGQIALPLFPAPITGPVRLTVFATFEPAASWSKKKRAQHLHRHHTQKPDTDNILKALKDGLNRIAWVDDSQVCEVVARKVWGLHAQTVVHVEALTLEDFAGGNA
jgi:Holliday junction resolvase RusA-like endonuclease